jgi:hypothetical protein|eukprot:SAG25_NODE_1150_length_3776_cov_2.507207_3_plen_37_part_00
MVVTGRMAGVHRDFQFTEQRIASAVAYVGMYEGSYT